MGDAMHVVQIVCGRKILISADNNYTYELSPVNTLLAIATEERICCWIIERLGHVYRQIHIYKIVCIYTVFISDKEITLHYITTCKW